MCLYKFRRYSPHISLSPVDSVRTAFAAIIVFFPMVKVPLLHIIFAPVHNTHSSLRTIPSNDVFGAFGNMLFRV